MSAIKLNINQEYIRSINGAEAIRLVDYIERATKRVRFPITQEYLRSIRDMTVDEAIEYTKTDWFSLRGNQFTNTSYLPQRLKILKELRMKKRVEVEYYLGNETGRSYFIALRGNAIYWGHANKLKETEYEQRSLTIDNNN